MIEIKTLRGIPPFLLNNNLIKKPSLVLSNIATNYLIPSFMSTTQISNPLVTSSVQDFMQTGSFTQVHNVVRENANHYPYVTFINKDNIAENIYFASTIAHNYEAGMRIEKGFFSDLQIGFTTNVNGETRTKLVPIGSSSRLALTDLF